MLSTYIEDRKETNDDMTNDDLQRHPRIIELNMRRMYSEAVELSNKVAGTISTMDYLNKNTTTLSNGRKFYNTTTSIHGSKSMVVVSGNESFLESAKKVMIDLFKQIGKMLKAIGKFIIDVANTIVKFINSLFKTKKDKKKKITEVENKIKFLEKESKKEHKDIKVISEALNEKMQSIVTNGVDMSDDTSYGAEIAEVINELREYNVLMFLKHYYDTDLVINFLRLGVEIRSTYVNYAGGMLLKVPHSFVERNDDIRYSNTSNLKDLFCTIYMKIESGETFTEKELTSTFRIFNNYVSSLSAITHAMPPIYKEVDPTEKGYVGANDLVKEIKNSNNLEEDAILILVSINATEVKYLTLKDNISADKLFEKLEDSVREIESFASTSIDLNSTLDNIDKAFKILIDAIDSFKINYNTWRPVISENEKDLFFAEKEILHKSAVQRVLPEIVLQSGIDEITIKKVKDLVTNTKSIKNIEKDIDDISKCMSGLEEMGDDETIRKVLNIGNDFKTTLNNLYRKSLEDMKIFRDLVRDGDQTYEDIIMLQKKITNIMIGALTDFKDKAST